MSMPDQYTPLGYQQITSLGASTALTIPGADNTGKKPTFCVLQAESQNVRWRDDGTAPTASVGMLLQTSAQQPQVYTGDLTKIRFIEATASAKLNVTYYG